MFSLYLVRVLKTHKHVHPCTLVCPLFTADSTLDSAVSYRLWPPIHSTAIRRHSERCILLSNVHFRIVFTDANKIYFYSPQTSRREACKLSGGRAYGRCFAWIKYVCIRWECRLNIDHAGTTLYTTIFISMFFEPGTSKDPARTLPSTKVADTIPPRPRSFAGCWIPSCRRPGRYIPLR